MISAKAVLVAVKVLSGGLQYVLFKTIIEWKVGENESGPIRFKKNVFMTVITFLSMLVVILPYYYIEVRNYNASRKLAGLPYAYPYSRQAHVLVFIPGLLGVLGVLLSSWSTKSLGATTMLLLKSLQIPVTAIMSKFIVKRNLKIYQLAAIAITILGVIPIGIAEHMEKESPGNNKAQAQWHMLISICFLVVSQVFNGIGDVYEERVIQHEKLSAEFVVFMESLYGLAISLVVMVVSNFVIIDGRSFESSNDTMLAILGNFGLQGLLVANIVLTGIHNYSTTLITGRLSSLHNVLISQIRPMVSFFVSLIIYYCMTKEYGEMFNAWSTLKFVGFGMFISAALLYNGNIKAPCKFCYPINDCKVADPASALEDDQAKDAEVVVI